MSQAPGAALRRTTLLAAILAVLVAAGGDAAAGAWPRAKGGTFLSLRADLERDADGRHRSLAAYAEYGLTDRLTLGATASDHSSVWNLPRAGGFVRLALGDLDAPLKRAVSVGVSSRYDPEMLEPPTPRLDAGLHLGRGFETRLGPGWASGSLELGFGEARTVSNLHVLAGMRPAEDWMTMLSGGRYRDASGTTDKLGAALGRRVAGETWAVLHLTREVSGGDLAAVGVALWFSF